MFSRFHGGLSNVSVDPTIPVPIPVLPVLEYRWARARCLTLAIWAWKRDFDSIWEKDVHFPPLERRLACEMGEYVSILKFVLATRWSMTRSFDTATRVVESTVDHRATCSTSRARLFLARSPPRFVPLSALTLCSGTWRRSRSFPPRARLLASRSSAPLPSAPPSTLPPRLPFIIVIRYHISLNSLTRR